MIELLEVLPRRDVMACLAAEGFSIGSELRHPRRKLSAMWILMTSRAGKVLPPIRDCILQFRIHAFPMAISAGDRNVGARQRKPGVLVPHQRECRRAESLHGVAGFATI